MIKHLLLISSLIVILMLSWVHVVALEPLRVQYKNSSDYDNIVLVDFDGLPYFNIFELNKTLNAYISYNVIDKRIFLDVYDQRFILLSNSSYLIHESQIYNFIQEIREVDGRLYLPLLFLQRLIGDILIDKVSYDAETNTLLADYPVDTSFKTIVIDPGHGGKDPGAIGYTGKIYEKDVVLEVAKLVREIIERNLDVDVFLTREDDRFIPLQERTRFANFHQANLFISLHCNASPRSSAEGIEVYFLSAARTDEARAVELMENSVVEKYEGGKEAVKMYDDLSFILMDMAQTEQLKESSYLALKLQANLVKETGAVDRGVKQAGFYVLRGAFMPSVLVELGFISNPREERRLIQKDHKKKLATAIYEGIKSYIYNYEMFR